MSKRVLLFFVCAFAACAGRAAAQPASETVFVDGAAFANVGWFSGVESANGPSAPGLSGTTGGGAVSVGTRLAPRFSVRLEIAAIGDLTDTDTHTTSAGLSSSPVFTQTDSLRQRERTVSVLVGYHTARRHHVELAYLGGVVFVFTEQRETLSTVVTPQPPTFVPENDSFVAHSYGATAEVGLDADIEISRHVSVVPQARMVADGVSVRPGVALRVHF